jgi:hypothetical protein
MWRKHSAGMLISSHPAPSRFISPYDQISNIASKEEIQKSSECT